MNFVVRRRRSVRIRELGRTMTEAVNRSDSVHLFGRYVYRGYIAHKTARSREIWIQRLRIITFHRPESRSKGPTSKSQLKKSAHLSADSTAVHGPRQTTHSVTISNPSLAVANTSNGLPRMLRKRWRTPHADSNASPTGHSA